MCTLNELSPALTWQNVSAPDIPNPNISKAENDQNWQKKKKVSYDSCPLLWFECEVCPRGHVFETLVPSWPISTEPHSRWEAASQGVCILGSRAATACMTESKKSTLDCHRLLLAWVRDRKHLLLHRTHSLSRAETVLGAKLEGLLAPSVILWLMGCTLSPGFKEAH